MSAYVPGRVSISEFLFTVLSAIPEVAALGPGHLWEGQAPAGVSGTIIVYQQVGPGRGVSPIGGQPVGANYRFQWRVGHEGSSMVPLVPIAKAIQARLNNARNEEAPDGNHISMTVITTDLPPLPVDDSGRPMQELGGEVDVFVNYT